MKNLIVVILALFTVIGLFGLMSEPEQRYTVFPMTDTIIAGTDSIVLFSFKAKYSNVYLNQTDAAATDSVYFEVKDESQLIWIRIGAVLMLDNSNVNFGGSGTATSKKYMINGNGIDSLRCRLENEGAGYVASRTILIDAEGVNNY